MVDNFCICMSLKKGGIVIGTITALTSLIGCIILIIYFASDYNDIAKEIANDDPNMINEIKEYQSCKVKFS